MPNTLGSPLPAGEYPPPSHGLGGTACTGPCRPLPPPLPLAHHTAVTWAASCRSNTWPSCLPLALCTYLSSCLKCTSLTPVHSLPSTVNAQKAQCHFKLASSMMSSWDLPGGPVDKSLPAKAGDTGSIPGLGRFHRQRSHEARCPPSTEACPGACALQQEKPLH